MRPVILIIRDGWGYSEIVEGNAVLAADSIKREDNIRQLHWFTVKRDRQPLDKLKLNDFFHYLILLRFLS